MPKNIAVVGAGVSGLTAGIRLAEQGNRVAILADEIGARTTSAAAAAIWYPYDAEPAEQVVAWALETFAVLKDLSRDQATGVSMLELWHFSRTGEIEIPGWARVLGARVVEEIPPAFASGFALEAPLTDTTIYLEYLAGRLAAAGGKIHPPVHLASLEEISREFDLVVNCAGVGARTLVHDSDVEPHRGQVVIVPKLDLAHAVVCDDAPLMYAIPRANDCVFGGTNEISDQRAANPAESARIVSECSRVLQIDAPVIAAERVGLRPFRRSGVRLAREAMKDGRAVIHNYGHGGSGFTLSWGCARTVVDLAN
ncbi:MAG TPA: FAD-dependent oxidoreductase [Chthoniobacterales bacterium]